MKEKNKLNDAERLDMILSALRITANKMAITLGYSSPSSIYHILKGDNSISTSMADRITTEFPEVNYLFVTKGELPVLITPEENRQVEQKFTFEEVPKTLMEIKELIIELKQLVKGDK